MKGVAFWGAGGSVGGGVCVSVKDGKVLVRTKGAG